MVSQVPGHICLFGKENAWGWNYRGRRQHIEVHASVSSTSTQGELCAHSGRWIDTANTTWLLAVTCNTGNAHKLNLKTWSHFEQVHASKVHKIISAVNAVPQPTTSNTSRGCPTVLCSIPNTQTKTKLGVMKAWSIRPSLVSKGYTSRHGQSDVCVMCSKQQYANLVIPGFDISHVSTLTVQTNL